MEPETDSGVIIGRVTEAHELVEKLKREVFAEEERRMTKRVVHKLLFYFLVGVAFGTTAYFTRSSLPAIPAHILGDLSFFFLIWPYDAARPLVWRDGADAWFWLNAVQAIVFAVLAVLAFRLIARMANSRAVERDVTQLDMNY